MADTRVRVVFEGSASGSVRASEEAKRGIEKIGPAGREAARGVDAIQDAADRGTRAIHEETRAMVELSAVSTLVGRSHLGMVAAMSGLTAGAAALGGAAIAGTAALAPLLGLIAAAPAGILAAGLAFGVLKLATENLSKAWGGNKKALAALTPAARDFLKVAKGELVPFFDKLQKTAQANLFPGLLAGLKAALSPQLFTTINAAIGSMAKSLGEVGRQLGTLLGSKPFLVDLGAVTQAAAGWMQTFGANIVGLLDAFVKLGAAAVPLVNWLGKLSASLVDNFNKSLDAARASGGLAQFFNDVRFSLQQFIQLVSGLGRIIGDVFGAGFQTGKQFISALNDGLARLHAFFQSAAGQTQLQTFFASVKNALAAVLPVLGALAVGILTTLPSALNALAAIFRTAGPALVQVIKGLALGLQESFRLIAEGFNRLAGPAREGMAAVQRAAVPVVAWYRAHFPEIREIVLSVFGWIKTNVVPAAVAAFRLLSTAAQGVVGAIREHWPEIRSTVAAVVNAARPLLELLALSFRLDAVEIRALTAVVKFLGPAFEVAFQATLAAVRVAANIIGAILRGLVATINGVVAALHALSAAAGAVGSVPGKVAGFAGGLLHGHFAAGGVVPGATGAPVPVLAHAGEIILNPGQQAVLGGPRFLSQLFGFTGEEGPGFATGGVVSSLKKPPHGKTSHPLPHHTLKPRGYTHLSTIAATALAAVDAVNQLESMGDLFYGQEERRMSIEHGFDSLTGFDSLYKTISVPVTYDHTGFDAGGNPVNKGDTVVNDFGEAIMQDIQVLDDAAFAQRLTDIDELISMRQAMLALLDDEKKKLETAIADLTKAVTALQAEITKEIAAAKAEKQRVADLEASIKAKREQIQDERAKRKTVKGKGKHAKPREVSAADPKLIGRLEDEISVMERELPGHRTAATAHATRAANLQSQLKPLSDDRDNARLNLGMTLPSDRRTVSLDIEELTIGRANTVSIPRETGRGFGTPGATGPAVAGAVGGDIGGAIASVTDQLGGAVATGVDQSELIAFLLAEIGQLKLALGVEAVQLPVIGAFQMGTLHVPQTGMALVHAGESITPAGRGGDGGSISDTSSYHEIQLNLGEPLNELVKQQVIKVTPEISLAIGGEAQRRRREGRN